MKNEILATVLVVLVAGSLTAGYFLGGVNKTVTISSTMTTTTFSTATRTAAFYSTFTTSVFLELPSSCTVPYSGRDSPTDNPNNTRQFPIISVPLDHVAILCVTYYDNNRNKSLNINLNEALQVGSIQGYPYSGCSPGPCTTYNFTSSPNFEVMSNVTSVEIGGNGNSMVTVAYAIIPNGGSPGFYWMSLSYIAPVSCSNEFPFAYGYSFSASNASLRYFPLPSGFYSSCISFLPIYYTQSPFAHLVGVSSDVEVTAPNETATYTQVST